MQTNFLMYKNNNNTLHLNNISNMMIPKCIIIID